MVVTFKIFGKVLGNTFIHFNFNFNDKTNASNRRQHLTCIHGVKNEKAESLY